MAEMANLSSIAKAIFRQLCHERAEKAQKSAKAIGQKCPVWLDDLSQVLFNPHSLIVQGICDSMLNICSDICFDFEGKRAKKKPFAKALELFAG